MSDPLELPTSQPPPDPTPPPPAPAKPRKRRWLRRTLWGVGVILVLLIVLVALAPTLLSTGPGTSVAERIGGGLVNGKLELEDLSLGWFSGTKVGGLSIEDEQGIRVVEVANFASGLTLWEALRQDFDLGETTGRVNLPKILVYEDGTTNLHEVFGIEPSSEESQEPMPQVTGNIKLDGMLNVQYVGKRDTAEDDSKAVDVDFTGTQLVLQPGQPLQHNLPLDLRVDGADAGQVAVVGSVDLDSLSAARPVIKEEVTLTNLQLPALGTLLTAFVPAMTDYELQGGVIGGTLTADLETNTLGGQITGSERIVVARRDAAGQGYETERFEMAMNGTFSEEELAESDQVTLADGTTIAVRRSVDLDQLSVTTDDGTVTAGALVDLFLLQTDPMANWPMLARDVTLDLQTDFATAQGGGANLGAFEVNASADLAKVNEKFGNLASAGGVQATQGTARINLKTQQAPGGEVTIPMEVNIENPTLVQAEPAAEAEAASAEVRQPAAELQQQQPGRISQDPPAAAEGATTQPVGPLELGLIRLVATATLPAPAKGAAMGLSNLAADFAVNDREQQAIVTGRVSAADLTAEATGGRLALENLTLPDYARLRQALGAWAPLPEESKPIEPITMSAIASYDGAAKAVALTEPLRVLIGQAELAVVNLAARQEQEGQWTIPELSAVVQVPALDAFLAKLGEETAQREEAQGQVTVRVVKDRPIQLATADIAGTLQGALEVVMEEVAARGVTVAGTLPVHLRGTSAAVPKDAKPLEVNGGTVALGGSTLDQVNQEWILRPRMAVNNVSMNPVVLEAAGKFVNPVFVDAEAAAGLLDVKLSGSDTLNLSDPYGSGSSMAMEFNIRELNIDNDIVAQFTEAALGETVGTLRQQLSAVPGLGQQLSAFDLSDEIKEDISSIRGNIMNAKVALKDGVASTNITFNVADPRVEASAAEQPLYPLAFAGGVNLQTLEAVDMNVTVPRVLIEKWVGENPDDLVKYFGQNPWQKLLPDGVRLKITGTMYVPLPDPLSLQTMAREVGTRAAKAAITGGVEDAIRRGLGDLLKPKE